MTRSPDPALVIAVAAVLIWGCTPGEDPRPEPAGTEPAPAVEARSWAARSLVVVTLDTTRPDRLEPYGATDVETPTLTRLAERGVVFERAYSVAPITLVSHASIFSGLYPYEHGVRNNGTHSVPAEVETLAERFRDAGARTAAFVSAAVLERIYGLDQGFEVYDDDLSTGWERHPRVVPDRPAEATVAASTAWLDTLGTSESFFLWVHFYDPHAAYSPPPPYRDDYRDRLYDGEIAYMDAQLGELLRHPRLSDRETAIVVVGDHGESLGEHGEQTHAILAYDSTLHVPLILRVPGAATGRRIPFPVDQVDLVPTLLDLFGMEPSVGSQGTNLLPWIAGTPDAPPPSRLLYGETLLPTYTYGWAELRVARRGPWKLVEGQRTELFDLSRDPRELTDLHARHPGTTHDLRRDLEERVAAATELEREASLELDAEAAERLRSLGYLAVGSGRTTRSSENRPDPRDAIGVHVRLEKARQISRHGLYDQAIGLVRGVLSEDPNNLAALTDLALYKDSAGDIEGAIEAVERALSLDPDFARLHLQMASLEARRGDVEKALALTEQALALDPVSLAARLQHSLRLQQVGRGEEARSGLDALLHEYPDRPEVLVAHAQRVEMSAGDLPGARNLLERALERDPFSVAAWLLLGDVLERTHRPEEARVAYQNGLQHRPDDPELQARLALLLARLGAGAEAEARLREAIRLSESLRPDLHVALGGWLAEHGRLAEAQRHYDRVLAENPHHPSARNNRAIAYYRTGRLEEARKELESLVEEFPGFSDAHNNLAAVAVDHEDWATAERHARETLALGVEAPPVLNNLGLALEHTGRLAEARSAYERALELEEGYWPARFNLGALLRRSGEPAAAAVALEEVLRRVPGWPEVYLELAELSAGPLGDPEAARRYWKAFLSMAPADPRTHEVRGRLEELELDPSRADDS